MVRPFFFRLDSNRLASAGGRCRVHGCRESCASTELRHRPLRKAEGKNRPSARSCACPPAPRSSSGTNLMRDADMWRCPPISRCRVCRLSTARRQWRRWGRRGSRYRNSVRAVSLHPAALSPTNSAAGSHTGGHSCAGGRRLREAGSKPGMREHRSRGSAVVQGLSFHGMRVSVSALGHWLAMRSRVWVSQTVGSTLFILQVSRRVAMVAAAIRAGEEAVLAGDGPGPDGALGGVGAELDQAVGQEALTA